MSNHRRSALLVVATCAISFLIGCPSSPAPTPPDKPTPVITSGPTQPPKTATCDCSVFPPKAGCDTQCGITTGVVEKVTADSITINVPSISQNPAGHSSAQIQQRTFAISPAESQQLQSIKQGSRVALTFHQESGQNIMKSIRPIPPEPTK
jgi:Cu/Ag efflux protein CusF